MVKPVCIVGVALYFVIRAIGMGTQSLDVMILADAIFFGLVVLGLFQAYKYFRRKRAAGKVE